MTPGLPRSIRVAVTRMPPNTNKFGFLRYFVLTRAVTFSMWLQFSFCPALRDPSRHSTERDPGQYWVMVHTSPSLRLQETSFLT